MLQSPRERASEPGKGPREKQAASVWSKEALAVASGAKGEPQKSDSSLSRGEGEISTPSPGVTPG